MAGNTLLSLLTTSSSTSKGEESFRRRLLLRSNLLRPCGSHTVSSSVSLSQEQWDLSCSVSPRSSTRLVSEGGQSWVTAAQQPWPRVLFVLPPCKPSSSYLTAAGANSTPKQQLSNTEPFREPAYMHHCFHACHCLMQPGFLLSHPCAPQCGITLHIWIVEILLFILRIRESGGYA